MALVTLNEILPAARREHRAVGAFNVVNYETALAVLKAAESENQPVIIQVFQRLFNTDKAADLAGMLLNLARRAKVPVALHLDHGANVRQVVVAIRAGYTSVMIDGSNLPLADNIRQTQEVVALAQAAGITTEAEIGHVAMGDATAITEVDEAVEFARTTHVNALAVSIGTSHGYYKALPHLDITRCQAIADALPEVPLVLHGGSATPMEQVKAAIHAGIAKINIATEFLDEYLKSTLAEIQNLQGKFVPPDKVYDPVVEACAKHAARLIREFCG